MDKYHEKKRASRDALQWSHLRIDQYDVRKVKVTGSETVGNIFSLIQLHSAQDERIRLLLLC
jgi:hypothetical protein